MLEYLDNFGQSHGFFVTLSEKTGLRHAYVVIGVTVISILLAIHAILHGLILFVFAVLVPAYKSFKVIESETKEDDTRMLHFWCVLGFLLIVDRFFGWMLTYLYFPGLIRFAILLALMYGDFAVSVKIYQLVVLPFLKKYHEHIEKATEVIKGVGQEAAKAKDMAVKEAVNVAVNEAMKQH